VDYELNNELKDELRPNENIVLSCRATPLNHLAKSMPIVLFAIPWTAFALFWIAAASNFTLPNFSDGIDLFPLFGIPFLLIGIGMLLSPVIRYFKAHKIIYAITNQRALEYHKGRTSKTITYLKEDIGNIIRFENKYGNGSLFFTGNNDNRRQRVGFKGIKNVREAEMYISNLKSHS